MPSSLKWLTATARSASPRKPAFSPTSPANPTQVTQATTVPPDQAELARPHGVTVHRDGTLYITASYNDRILKIGP
jgi:glucose/arabinose dehydrogenase